MITVELPDAIDQAVDLLPADDASIDEERNRWRYLPSSGADGDEVRPEIPADLLEDRLTLGEPMARAIGPVELAADADLAAYVNSENRRYRFVLLPFKVTFRPRKGEEFIQAWFQVELEREDGRPSPPLIAWSMTPLKETEIATTTRTIGFRPKLKIASVVELEPGGADEQTTSERSDAVVLGYYEGQSAPAWEFRKGRSRAIDGVARLGLIVRVPLGSRGRGRVSADVTVQRERLGIFRYRADMSNPSLAAFTLD
jgi:hypothetical protein